MNDAGGSPILRFVNDGAGGLEATNYFQSAAAARGLYHLTINHGKARLLVPRLQHGMLQEMRSGHYCVISAGELDGDAALELLFVDGSRTPFSIHLWLHQVTGDLRRLPSEHQLLAYCADGRHYTWRSYYRRQFVHLPCLRPWPQETLNTGVR